MYLSIYHLSTSPYYCSITEEIPLLKMYHFEQSTPDPLTHKMSRGDSSSLCMTHDNSGHSLLYKLKGKHRYPLFTNAPRCEETRRSGSGCLSASQDWQWESLTLWQARWAGGGGTPGMCLMSRVQIHGPDLKPWPPYQSSPSPDQILLWAATAMSHSFRCPGSRLGTNKDEAGRSTN